MTRGEVGNFSWIPFLRTFEAQLMCDVVAKCIADYDRVLGTEDDGGLGTEDDGGAGGTRHDVSTKKR
jgi:hypothetical protein